MSGKDQLVNNLNTITLHKQLHLVRKAWISCTYHNIKLFRLRNKLHTTVVHNDFTIFNCRIFRCNLTTRLQEQTISKLHDICFMHCRHFLSVVEVSILKSVLGNPFRAELRHHLEINSVSITWRNNLLDNRMKQENDLHAFYFRNRL